MVYVIAEAGSNYNGSVEMAYRLNEAAREAGAHCIKYQIINPDELYLMGDYRYGKYRSTDVLKIRELNVLDDDDWWKIRNHALELGLDFSASVFDDTGLELLTAMKPPFVKIASTDLNNHLFIRRVARSGLKVLLSTGMSSLAEIHESVEVLFDSGSSFEDLVIMHCVSSYPVGRSATRIGFLEKIRNLSAEVGFSDHSTGAESAIAALALGATWFEKHFTIDKSLPGLDHAHSLDPLELKEYVSTIIDMQMSLSTAVPKVSSEEAETAKRARRGVYARTDILKGGIIKETDLRIVRPPTHLAADQVNLVLGKRALRDIPAGTPVQENIVGD